MPKPKKLQSKTLTQESSPSQQQPLQLESPTEGADYSAGSEATSAVDANQPDFDAIAAEISAGEPVQEVSTQITGVLTKEQFYAGFGGMFAMASAMTGLKSLTIDESDQMARQASDVIYDTAAEIEMFRFLIQPGNIYVQRSLVVLAFAVPKYQAVKAEAMARRSVKPVQHKTAAPETAMVEPADDVSNPLSPNFGQGLN